VRPCWIARVPQAAAPNKPVHLGSSPGQREMAAHAGDAAERPGGRFPQCPLGLGAVGVVGNGAILGGGTGWTGGAPIRTTGRCRLPGQRALDNRGVEATSATVSTAQARLVGLQGQDRAYLWLSIPRRLSGVVIERRTPAADQRATVEVQGPGAGQFTGSSGGTPARERSSGGETPRLAGIVRWQCPRSTGTSPAR